MLRKRSITAKRAPRTLKPQKARQLIRRFHVLQKSRAALLQRAAAWAPVTDSTYKTALGKPYTEAYAELLRAKAPYTASVADANTLDEVAVQLAAIDAEETAKGGLHVYQMASTMGQKELRGGDSLKHLVQWAAELQFSANDTLEIGSLSPENCILTCGRFGIVTRIDLNSQSPLILQQDFMERPLPKNDTDMFDLVLCLLVLNFVPSPAQRGAMLRRITDFLRMDGWLFFVVPLPCISNSRYFDQDLLRQVMLSLGLHQVKYHEAKKVVYVLYQRKGPVQQRKWKKKELHAGPTRNNFYVDLLQEKK